MFKWTDLPAIQTWQVPNTMLQATQIKLGAKCPTSMLYTCFCHGLECHPTLACEFKPGKMRCSDEGKMS